MSTKQSGCQIFLLCFSFNFSFNKNSYLNKKSPILPNMHKNLSAKEGWDVYGKVISGFEPLRFEAGWLIQKLELLAKDASMILHWKRKIDFQFLSILWFTINVFLLKEAYFHLSFLNYINWFLIKEAAALLIMKGEDLYKLKDCILKSPGYNHCWVQAIVVRSLGKCRKCFYMLTGEAMLCGILKWHCQESDRDKNQLFWKVMQIMNQQRAPDKQIAWYITVLHQNFIELSSVLLTSRKKVVFFFKRKTFYSIFLMLRFKKLFNWT